MGEKRNDRASASSVTIAQERREPSAELTVGTPASDCPVAVTDSRAKIRAVTTSAPPLIRPRSIARTLRDILTGFGVVAAGVLAVVVLVLGIRHYGFGWDSRAYWLAWRHHGLYGNHAEELGAYLYSPVFAELVWPLTTLSWPVFATLWAVATAGIFVWLLWPLELPWRLFCLLLVLPEVVNGNLWAVFALVLVFGFAYPWLWSVPLLTKVTSGLVGLTWFAVRREWRPLLIALTSSAAIVLVSAAANSGLWRDWLVFLTHGGGHGAGYAVSGRVIPPAVRLPVALLLTVIGARRGRPTWLAWATLLASPVFAYQGLSILAALPRLHRGHTGRSLGLS